MIAPLAVCATALLLAPPPQGPAKPTVVARPIQAQPARPTDKTKPFELLPIETSIVQHTNAQRTRYGLAALEVDPSLMQSARSHASWMARTANMAHTRQPVAENIAMGQPNTPNVLQSWMSSSGHRANILNHGHRRIGVAAYRTGNGTIFWCQQFR